ncbi:hypothetical protein C0991_006848 [Blastosporella zonata]|nr:hypothetical protein C0991_006848 [Blastosporella zonata]
MIVARIIQGVSSSVVWVVGLALLYVKLFSLQMLRRFLYTQLRCDARKVGRKSIIGPPVGGALFTHFGYRGPFIFGVIGTAFDLAARLLIIERKDALRWGMDPKEMEHNSSKEQSAGQNANVPPKESPEELHGKDLETTEMSPAQTEGHVATSSTVDGQEKPQPVSLPMVLSRLVKSSRALMDIFTAFSTLHTE